MDALADPLHRFLIVQGEGVELTVLRVDSDRIRRSTREIRASRQEPCGRNGCSGHEHADGTEQDGATRRSGDAVGCVGGVSVGGHRFSRYRRLCAVGSLPFGGGQGSRGYPECRKPVPGAGGSR